MPKYLHNQFDKIVFAYQAEEDFTLTNAYGTFKGFEGDYIIPYAEDRQCVVAKDIFEMNHKLLSETALKMLEGYEGMEYIDELDTLKIHTKTNKN